jgi:hypothetical protein
VQAKLERRRVLDEETTEESKKGNRDKKFSRFEEFPH